MKNVFSFFNFATQFVWRFTIALTAILIIWHITLVKSDIPFINHWGSWVTTVITPFFTLIGCNAIYWFYLKKGKIFGDAAKVTGEVGLDGFANMAEIGDAEIEGCLIIIGLVLFIALLPVIMWFLPAEFLLGRLYYKHTIWEEVKHAWQTLTWKESVFIITKAFLLAGTISFIVWEIFAHLVQYCYKVGVFVKRGTNKI
jgi:hypothetical protein